ncbi:MAG: hypothetical protein AB7N73_05440 [Gemmatimonadales bacterium]
MKRRLIALGLVISMAYGALVLAEGPDVPAQLFQVSVVRTSDGWTARCDTGCAWREVAIACANSCPIFLDANGVTADVARPQTSTAFGMVIRRAGKGWEAESVTGTAWQRLGWSCPMERCGARISEHGVVTMPFGV